MILALAGEYAVLAVALSATAIVAVRLVEWFIDYLAGNID